MIAWVLNLDADLELARPHRYTPTRQSREANATRRPLAMALVGADAVVLDEGDRLSEANRGILGRAFCPTPRALRILRSAGAIPEPAPPLEVLRAVNSRAFAARGLPMNDPWGSSDRSMISTPHSGGGDSSDRSTRRFAGPKLGESDFPESRFFADVDSAIRAVGQSSPSGRWLAKRAFGFAGKGQRRIAGPPSAADVAWIAASMLLGGLQIEPFVEIALEVALHGHIAPERVSRGRPCVQRCDAFGAWQSSRLASGGELLPDESRALDHAFDETAAALVRAGYFGPFGLDAFRWRDPNGAVRFRACSEINARYTMGYAVGMSAHVDDGAAGARRR